MSAAFAAAAGALARSWVVTDAGGGTAIGPSALASFKACKTLKDSLNRWILCLRRCAGKQPREEAGLLDLGISGTMIGNARLGVAQSVPENLFGPAWSPDCVPCGVYDRGPNDKTGRISEPHVNGRK